MKSLKKMFIIFISVIIGLYLGGKYGIYLTENDIVDLGPQAGNVFYPFFWLVMSIVGGIIFGVIIGLYFIFSKRNKIKK